LVGYYLKTNAARYYQIEPIRKNIANSAQTVTRSSEAIDSALKSVNAQIALVKDLLTANMKSTNKAQLETFNQRLPETTEQFKKLVEATEVLKESRQTLEEHRQQLLGLRGQLSRMRS
jgi:chromosome segregation ATPase